MDIQETGLAFVTRRAEAIELLVELNALFSDHADWSDYGRCPVQLPMIRTIWEDLQRRFGTMQSHTPAHQDAGYQPPSPHLTGPMAAIKEGQ